MARKERVTVCIDKEILKMIDHIIEKKYNNLVSRSSLIDYYLKKSVAEDYQKIVREHSGGILT